MRFKGLTSVLEVTTSGYVLKAESELPAATQPTYPLHHRASARMRNDLVKTGAIAEVRPGVLWVTRDILFEAPTTPSSIVRDGPGLKRHWGKPQRHAPRPSPEVEP
jgi:hypothetical protein